MTADLVAALELTAIGAYAIIPFFVARRTRELGLRGAFGVAAADGGAGTATRICRRPIAGQAQSRVNADDPTV